MNTPLESPFETLGMVESSDLRILKGAVKVKQPIHAVTQPFHRWKIIIKTNQNMEIFTILNLKSVLILHLLMFAFTSDAKKFEFSLLEVFKLNDNNTLQPVPVVVFNEQRNDSKNKLTLLWSKTLN
jgi:hypothetical protein